MILAWYFIDIWTKRAWDLTPLDELALVAEIIVVVAVLVVLAAVVSGLRASLPRKTSDSLPAAAGPFPMSLAARDRRARQIGPTTSWYGPPLRISRPPDTGFKPVPTPAPPPDRPA
jgi:hypothetical protein